MADNLFEKIDDLGRKMDNMASVLNELNANSSSAQSQNAFNSQVSATNNRLILQNFIQTSTKRYHFLGGAANFEKEKQTSYIKFGAILLVGLLVTILTSIACGIYSTFTLFENIWMIFIIAMMLHIKKSEVDYLDIDYSLHSAKKFITNADNRLCPEKLRFSYKLFRTLSYISTICNIIYILFIKFNGFISVLAAIFEVAFLVGTWLTMVFYDDYFCLYSAVYFTGNVPGKSEPVTLVHETMLNQLYTKEDYEKKFNIRG